VDIPETGEPVAAKSLGLEALVISGRVFSFSVLLGVLLVAGVFLT